MNAKELATKIRQHVNSATVTDAEWKAYVRSFKDLPALGRIECWALLTAGTLGTPEGEESLRIAKTVHPYFCDLLLEVFKVPRGEAGQGVVPHIPPGLKVDK